MFDEVVNEPVPDEFLDILRRADERSSGGERRMSGAGQSAAASRPQPTTTPSSGSWSR